ncbi:MAG: hypothetical protein JO222_05310, partial [Frankiales bacterium]|nr:hypothetical protein [Frankiales bacterium]
MRVPLVRSLGVVVAMAAISAGSALTAAADPVQGCNDATPQPTSFCIKYDANVTKNGIETPTPAEAGDVGDFNWSLVNSSSNEP